MDSGAIERRRQGVWVVALAAAGTGVVGSAARGTPTVDGVLDGEYGSPVAVQVNPTGFGDSGLGQQDYANGSELDAAYGKVAGGTLYLMLTGNLESNFNHLEMFIDSTPGGQHTLSKNNLNIDFHALERMGENLDGTNASANDKIGPGLTFDSGFKADYYIGVGGATNQATGAYGMYANYASLPTVPTADNQVGRGLDGGGSGRSVADGVTGIAVTIDNSNTLGVTGATASDGDARAVGTGIEYGIPLSAIGNPVGLVKVTAFVNGTGHDFVSNQMLGALPSGYGNMGEPRTLDLSQQPGGQYFLVYLTVPGDANSNGVIDRDDFAAIDRGFAKYAGGEIGPYDAGWVDGDFNGDGVVDAGDYFLIDSGYGQQVGSLSPELLDLRRAEFGDGYVNALVASVPEPGAVGVVVAAMGAMGVRRGRRRR